MTVFQVSSEGRVRRSCRELEWLGVSSCTGGLLTPTLNTSLPLSPAELCLVGESRDTRSPW